MPLDFVDPSDSPQDLISVALASSLLLLSAASFAAILLRFRRRRHRIHDLLSPLWPVRLLLPLFASLWSFSHLLRSHVIRSRFPLLQRHPAPLCHAYLVSSQHLAEPAFLIVLLFLLRASTRPRDASSAASVFAAALAASLLAVLPFLFLHSLYLYIFPKAYASSSSSSSDRCAYPLFGTVLLAVFSAVFVPIFVSASWEAVSIVINRRLRRRLYVLCAAVVGSISVQVTALALSILWNPDDNAFQWLFVIDTAASVAMISFGEVILVFCPAVDALSVGDVAEAVQREEAARNTCVAHAQQPVFSVV